MLRTLLCFLLMLTACAEQPPAPAQNDPTQSQPRIAVLSPALALILTDLGLADRIVARHAWDQFLPKTIPTAGDQSGIDYEALLATEPTHILLEWGQRDLPPRLTKLTEESQWQLSNHTLLTLEDIIETTRSIAATFSIESDIPDQLEQAWKPKPKTDSGAVILLIQTTPELAALGPGSAHQQILTRLGHTPALTDGAPYQILLAEDLAALDPAHIVIIAPGAEPNAIELGPIDRLGLTDRVHTLTGPADLIPSPRLLDFTARLEAELAREAPTPSQAPNSP